MPERTRLTRFSVFVLFALSSLYITAFAPASAPLITHVTAATADAATAVATGSGHTCALTDQGGVKCWGDNLYGELGDGTTQSKLTPVDVSGLSTGVIAIASGSLHTCALMASRGVKCWGRNEYGQLGDGTVTNRQIPVDVTGLSSGVAAITTGSDHTCALTTNGGVKCWGWNAGGRLGDGTIIDRHTPTDVSGMTSGVKNIAAGWYHTCAVTTSGGVKCWGENEYGQLGDGTTVFARYTPTNVSGLSSGIQQIASGSWHTCAITGGSIKCWGNNDYGQLGNGTNNYTLFPVDVINFSNAIQVTVGRFHTCALATNASVKCWGGNQLGQIGDGTQQNQFSPANVTNIGVGTTSITTGNSSYHSCAVTIKNGIKCWGNNGNGGLGDGTTVNRLTPVDVQGFEGVAASSSSIGKIAFASSRDYADEINSDVYVMNADGSDVHRLTTQGAADPDWSPDGRYIAFQSPANSVNLAQINIYVMNADGSNIHRITTFGGIAPAWSPDGKQIAFTASQSSIDGDTSNIYVMNADGSDTPHRITTQGGTEADWSPDGTQIAFSYSRNCDPTFPACLPSIYIIGADGKGEHLLHGGGRPRWSPDGKRIVYETYGDYAGSSEIGVIKSDGSDDKVGGNFGLFEAWTPSWSPDSTKIVFAGSPTQNADSNIYTINAEGTSLTRIATSSGSDFQPSWVNVSSCTNSTVTGVNLAITKIVDSHGATIYVPDFTGRGTIDGNDVTVSVRVDNCGAIDVQGSVSLSLSNAQMPITISPFGSKEISLTFNTLDMAWSHKQHKPSEAYNLFAAFTSSNGSTSSPSVPFIVRPRPVVLVHGYNEDVQWWNTYITSFLPSLDSRVVAYAVNMNTGTLGTPTNTIDQNAQLLQRVIEQARREQGADQVDVVAHSMGGLITRRYLAAYATGKPIYQVIMLGTPNRGSKSADVIGIACIPLGLAVYDPIPLCRFPADLELTVESVEIFNLWNTERRGALFYVVAGQYFCDHDIPFNPIEGIPNDIIVWTNSAFAIATDGKWVVPPEGPGCKGRHEWMGDAKTPDHGGFLIFDQYVKPLLQGSVPPTVQAQNVVTATQPMTDAFDALQTTDVQTGTLQPGKHIEFERTPEPGLDGTYSFVVVGPPERLTVRLRDPLGNVITPTVKDAAVQYMQMSQNLLPITSYTISNPVQGNWTTIVEANAQTPVSGVPVAALGSIHSDLRLTAPFSGAEPTVGHPITITAQLRIGNLPLTTATITATLLQPDGGHRIVVLHDDGHSGDGAANDGVYGYAFTPRELGVYAATLSARGSYGTTTFTRTKLWATYVTGHQAFLPLVRR